MHGQSDYTPTKQRHLMGLLDTCAYAFDPRVNGKPRWAHPEVIIIDGTAGSGHTDEGECGSPILINKWAEAKYRTAFRQLCCELKPQNYVRLNRNHLFQAEIKLGKYQDIAPGWLDALGISVKRPALGFVYVDPNGAQDLIEGMEFFKQLAQDPRFYCLDFIFHWSMAAYSRNRGKGNEWAQTPILDVTDELARLKRHAYMREPLDNWQWVFMHLINTSKVKPVWKIERVLKYSDWCAEYSGKFVKQADKQLSLLAESDEVDDE